MEGSTVQILKRDSQKSAGLNWNSSLEDWTSTVNSQEDWNGIDNNITGLNLNLHMAAVHVNAKSCNTATTNVLL
jgi:hypothetical protein